ncbi:MAG: MBL fold metallo-hydrolase [Lachnospiraceae bacterium]|nr:MBL fold metallo-hydrolase [Lachnospiraceae bacterium]
MNRDYSVRSFFIRSFCCAVFILQSLVFLSGCGRKEDASLYVYAFSAGAADSFLITTGRSAVMIDCGEKNDGEDIADHLLRAGITHLDYLIISHFDKDHIGGAKKILANVSVDHILEPDYVKDSDTFERYQKAVEEEKSDTEKITEPFSFELDGIRYHVDPADGGYEDDESNNSSLIVSVTNKDDTMLFMGDAEKERIAEYLERDDSTYDLLKVPHHGRLDDNTDELVNSVKPQIAVITSSEDEPEDGEVVRILEDSGAKVYLTIDGPVLIESSGSGINARTVVE